MPVPGPRMPRSLPESVRRRVEVATAMAWEALIDTHTQQALEFVNLLEGRLTLEEALTRYLREMDVTEAISSAVRTRVLIELEQPEHNKPHLQVHEPTEPPPEDDDEGWRRFRPDVMVRGVRERQRR